jgi:hypothetical protein
MLVTSIKRRDSGLDFALFKSDRFQWDVNVNASKCRKKNRYKIAHSLPIFTGGTGARWEELK